MNVLSEAWARYADSVIPKDAPRVQYIESRRAFYAGAHSLFAGLMRMLEPGTEPTERDLAKLTDLKQEIDQFYADLAAGRA